MEPEAQNTAATRNWILLGLGLAALAVCLISGGILVAVVGALGSLEGPRLGPRAPWGPPLEVTASEAEVQALAFREPNGSSPRRSGVTYAPQRVYPYGGYGVIEVADLRLAVRGLEVEDDSGWVEIVMPEGGKGRSTSRRGGVVILESSRAGGRSLNRVYGFEFVLEAGELTLRGPEGEQTLRAPVTGNRRVIIVDRDGGNVQVLPWTGRD